MYEFIRRQKLNIATVISVILLVLFYAVGASAKDVSTPTPHDYTQGIFDLMSDNIISHNIPDVWIDNNTTTNSKFNRSQTYQVNFKNPINLTGIFIANHQNYSSDLRMIFVDDVGEIYRHNLKSNNRDGVYIDVDRSNVTQIIMESDKAGAGSVSGSRYIRELDFFGRTVLDYVAPVTVQTVKVLPTSVNFKVDGVHDRYEVYVNGQLYKTDTNGEITITGLSPNTKYDFGFVNVKGDNKSKMLKKEVTTPNPPPQEVDKLNVKAVDHTQVNLNWQNPNQDNFEYVTIYRDVVTGGLLKNLLSAVDPMPVAYADEGDSGPTKLFETNGTYFIDHSVAQSTKYEYVVTTTASGVESQGVKKSVTVPAKPAPTPPNSEMGTNDDGDYVVSWTQTTGQIKIIVGGQPYVTVAASTGSYTVPEADMVYNWLGNPQVQVIWIDEDGDESVSVAPGPPGSTTGNGSNNGGSGGNGGLGTTTPITAKDVLQGTMSFILLLSPLILLGIIVYFVPRIIEVIKSTLRKKGAIR